jgi:pilus assembly protein CpaB
MARSVAGAAPGRTNRRFLIIAVLFAALSGALVFAWMSAQDKGGGGGGSGAAGSQEAVVAKTEIRQRTTITADMLEVKSIPANLIVAGHYTTIDDVVGKVTKLPIRANEQVVLNSVVDTSGPSVEALSQVVPTGRRGFSINATQVRTAGGLILPGDYVDIVWVCCEKGLEFGTGADGQKSKAEGIILARTIAQNVQVAAVAQQIISSGPVSSDDGTGIGDDPVASESGDQEPEAITITLLVTPEQAHVLMMGEGTGELRAALRGVGDETIVPPSEDFEYLSPGLIPEEIMQALREAFGSRTTP